MRSIHKVRSCLNKKNSVSSKGSIFDTYLAEATFAPKDVSKAKCKKYLENVSIN